MPPTAELESACPAGMVIAERLTSTTALFEQATAGIQAQLDTNHEEHDKVWEALDRLRNRPPTWVVPVMSALTCGLGVVGALLAAKLSGG